LKHRRKEGREGGRQRGREGGREGILTVFHYFLHLWKSKPPQPRAVKRKIAKDRTKARRRDRLRRRHHMLCCSRRDCLRVAREGARKGRREGRREKKAVRRKVETPRRHMRSSWLPPSLLPFELHGLLAEPVSLVHQQLDLLAPG